MKGLRSWGVKAGWLALAVSAWPQPATAGVDHWVQQCVREGSVPWCEQRGRQMAATGAADPSAAFNLDSGFARTFAAEYGTQSPGIRLRTGGQLPRGALELVPADRERVRSPDGLHAFLSERAGKGDLRIDFLYAGSSKAPERVQRMQRVAMAGHPDAMYVVGFMYANGLDGLKRDDAQAYQWYGKAAKAGNATAMGVQARMMAARGGSAVADALRLAGEGCERGSQAACLARADITIATLDSRELPPEEKEQIVADAMKTFTGVLLRDSRSFSLEPERQAALYSLAKIYVDGRVVPANKVEARDDLARALNVDGAMLTDAWMAYADAVIAGPDGPYEYARDAKKGLDILRRFADMGDPGATLALGRALLGGQEGVKADPMAGRALLKRAAGDGDSLAMTALARHYAEDNNDPEAFRWVQQAVAAGDPYGHYLAARHYLKGLGTDKNESAFKTSLQKSCDMEYLQACIDIGQAMVQGSDGFAQDVDGGLDLLERVRAKGSARASFLIGSTRLRQAGADNAEKLQLALLGLIEASQRGSKEADEALARIEKGDNAVMRNALLRAKGEKVPEQVSIQEAAERAAQAPVSVPVAPEGAAASGKKKSAAKPAAPMKPASSKASSALRPQL